MTKREKAEAKVILTLLVTGLLLEGVNIEGGGEKHNPAVSQITAYIDELLAEKDEDRRKVMVDKVQKARVKLTKKIKDVDKGSALVGALRFLTGGTIHTRQGTRLDFIITTFRKNLAVIEDGVPFRPAGADLTERALKGSVQSI